MPFPSTPVSGFLVCSGAEYKGRGELWTEAIVATIVHCLYPEVIAVVAIAIRLQGKPIAV